MCGCACGHTGFAAAWEALFIYDSVIFGLTVYKAVVSRRCLPPAESNINITGGMPPLVWLLLRDGANHSRGL
jgi:hypothetical protein